MSDVLKLSVPAKPEYVSLVRLAISSVANTIGFDVEAIEDIKIAMAEACNNAVLHGCKECSENYEVEVCVNENSLLIIVKDNGKGYNSLNYKEPDINCPKEGGLGIFIIKSLMDDVEIYSENGKGTTIRMKKNIQ